MRSIPLSLAAVLAGLLPVSGTLSAQYAPKRPSLGADTNSAVAYYSYGVSVLEQDPQKAADAFFWASRLDPTWALPLYAGRIAQLMAADDRFVIGYVDGNKSFTHSREARRFDSLEVRARMLDPFLNRELDKTLLLRYLRALFDIAQQADGGSEDRAAAQRFQYYVERYMRTDAPPWMRAMLALSERRFPDALAAYGEQLSRDRNHAAEIHEARARAFFLMGNGDSARAEMQQSLDKLRQKDSKDFVYLYESKALLEHFIGLTYERQDQLAQAREAYGRALQEDLSYYPAHLRLGMVALASGDTATALTEIDLAVQIRDDEPAVQMTYGAMLTQMNHLNEAEQHLQRAVELDPYFATPYYVLGRVAEYEGKSAEAVADYRNYLSRTRAQDPRIAEVQRRLTDLGGAVSSNR